MNARLSEVTIQIKLRLIINVFVNNCIWDECWRYGWRYQWWWQRRCVRVCGGDGVWFCALAWGALKCENCVTYRNFGGFVFLSVQHFVDTTDENSFVQSACVKFVFYMYKFHNIYANYFDTQHSIEPITQHFAFVFNTCFTTISLFSFVFFFFCLLFCWLCCVSLLLSMHSKGCGKVK